MQTIILNNKKLTREWQRRKKSIRRQRAAAKDKTIPLPKIPDLVNEYINKGFMFDTLNKIPILTKKISIDKSRTKKAGNLLEERKICPTGKR